MRRLHLLGLACACFLLLPAPVLPQGSGPGAVEARSARPDPRVAFLTKQVSAAELSGHVAALQGFQTRYTFAQGNTDAGNWLYDRFQALGLEVERHTFSWGTYTEENIIARIHGLTRPQEIVAISAHFDSTSEQPYTYAPGADDDASGIAGVLEAARILSLHPFERTIEFMCFNAEEQQRRGSQAIAQDYLNLGKQLLAVVNSDMIGYWPTGWQRTLDVAYEPMAEWLADHVVSVCDRYVGIPISKHLSAMCRDDHVSFSDRGFAAVTNMDCWDAHNGGPESTPHYHRTTDRLGTLRIDCMTQVVQLNVAAVAELAIPQ